MATQARRNFEAFERRLEAELVPEHEGEVALLRNEEVAGIYPDCEAAFAAGMEQFGSRGEFSYQEIGAEPVFVSTLSLGANE